jgi:hypothetical protein
LLQLVFSREGEAMNDTDPLDWSRKYEVLTISRLVLSSLGFTTEQITSLSDDDMQRVAEKLNNDYFIGFEEDVKFVVSCELAEKRKHEQEPMQQESNT